MLVAFPKGRRAPIRFDGCFRRYIIAHCGGVVAEGFQGLEVVQGAEVWVAKLLEQRQSPLVVPGPEGGGNFRLVLLLLRRFGLDFLNEQFKEIGLEKTHLERLFFDGEAAARGLENRIVPEEMGALLEQIAQRRFVSEAVSAEMEKLLLEQQINHKIPGYLPEGTPVAHKTGEDDGITHDVGILYAKEPVIACFVGEHVDVPAYERLMQDAALRLCGEA